jgi:rubrerythrin
VNQKPHPEQPFLNGTMEHYELTQQRDLFAILEEAIAREDLDHDRYAEAAKLTDNPTTKKLLLELAAMEHQHHLILEKMLNEMKGVAELQDDINESCA